MSKIVTKKGKSFPMLPQILTIIKQPNRVTAAKYDYTLLQQKMFSYIMKELQEHINVQVSGKISVNQLALFKDDNKITLKIPLKEMGTNPTHYNEIIESLKQIMSVQIEFPYKSELGKEYLIYSSLLSSVIVPKDKKYRKEVFITIDKEIAMELISIQGGYTRYSYEISFNAKCKYTPRVYQLICRWRDKGGFRMKYQEFREWINVGDKYKDWKDFKKRIIKEVQAELTERADVWFEVELEKDGTGIYLNFKVITTDDMKMVDAKREQIVTLLKRHFGFSDDDLKALSAYIVKPNLVEDFANKLIEVKEYLSTNRNITNVPAYVIASITKAFKHRI